MKKITKVSIIGIVFYLIGSVLTDDPANLKIGITIVFASVFLFGGITTMELIRRKKITIEN